MRMILTAAAAALTLAACSSEPEVATDNVVLGEETGMMNDTAMAGGDMMAGGSGPVTVTVNGVQPNSGQVWVALQTGQEFLQASGSYNTKVDASAGTVTATFTGVPAGDYAAVAVQDTNSDGQIAVEQMGPSEPWGLSGAPQTGVQPEYGPATFQVGPSGGTATVTLNPAR